MLPRIVLVEPQGARNVGSIARVMKNFGFSELWLVRPRCDPLGEEARQMATHAKEVLESANLVETLEEALDSCSRVLATTAQSRYRNVTLEEPSACLPWLLEETSPSALMFGPEDRGLNNEELTWAPRWLRIPTGPYQTLNLAQAVGICCYEMYVQQNRTTGPPAPSSRFPEASIPEIQHFLERWADQLEVTGFLYPHTRAERVAKLRNLLYRAQLTQPELALLQGIVSQTNWALSQKSSLQPERLEKDGPDPDRG